MNMAEKIELVTEATNKLSKPRKKKYEHLFIKTRKLMRAWMRRDYGQNAFKKSKEGDLYPWEKYQAENRGKPKTVTEWRISNSLKKKAAKQSRRANRHA